MPMLAYPHDGADESAGEILVAKLDFRDAMALERRDGFANGSGTLFNQFRNMFYQKDEDPRFSK